jgi:hypothetical protein
MPEMVGRIATALIIDPTELFFREINPAETMKNSQKVVLMDVGGAVNRLISDFIAERLKELNEETG